MRLYNASHEGIPQPRTREKSIPNRFTYCRTSLRSIGEPLVDRPEARHLALNLVLRSNFRTILSRTPAAQHLHVPLLKLLEHTLRGIRIIVVGMSSLLGDMLARTLAKKWLIESITRLELSGDLAEHLSGMVADLVVAERVSGASDAITADLLTIHPDISLLELSADGRMAWFYRTGRPMSVLVGFSPQELIDMLDSGGVGSFAAGATRGNGV